MSNGRPHPKAVDSTIGPELPLASELHIMGGELELTGHRLAARTVLYGLGGRSEHLIVWDWRTGGKYVVRFLSFAYASRRPDPTVPNPQEIMYSRRVRAKFVDDYRLLIAASDGFTKTPQLWDTTAPAQAWSNTSIELRLGPDYTIDTRFENSFYFNLGLSHDAPFHEDGSRQLVGICVTSSPPCGGYSVLLVTRYGDFVNLASKEKSRVEWSAWENFIIPIELKLGVQEFGLLQSHLLVTRKDLNDSGTLLLVYDFTVRSRRQQARDEAVSGPLPPYTVREFLLDLDAEDESSIDFRFMEDAILASTVSALLIWSVHDLTYAISRTFMDPHRYGYGRFRGGGAIRPTQAAAFTALTGRELSRSSILCFTLAHRS